MHRYLPHGGHVAHSNEHSRSRSVGRFPATAFDIRAGGRSGKTATLEVVEMARRQGM